jgi:hypothetical protein
MAHVLGVPAFQLRDPITSLVPMKVDNFPLHRFEIYEAVRMASDFASR